ncbi:siderophore-iron reductase FhuF [Salinisphaera sp. USBA-960]|uniref:siderophore-iron reductase FhuF n=1 Tax=Salinisphaera orenii TaxID=856731 RepID=UPI000DBE8A5D|nr:siderophore-iron reductase FhuF [Salifodinibacter halophilus]NNC25624.1 siderophore-iron reductase FhuF [Salifodinibacter halophilus]
MNHAHFFSGNLQAFADVFSAQPWPQAEVVVPGIDLIAGHSLDPLLQTFANTCDLEDRRATISQWSKYFFARLIIPATVIEHGTSSGLVLSADRWHAACAADGTVKHFVFARDPVTDNRRAGDMTSLIDDVIAPMTATLAAASGLSARVFSSNATMYYNWVLEQLAHQAASPNTILRRARSLMNTPVRPDGGFNPFYAQFKTLSPGARDGNGEPTEQCRRLCCVQDCDPSLGLCANCPRAIKRQTSAPQTSCALTN